MGTLERDITEQGFELRQTHISLVFLAEDRVFKVKKPVNLGFVDYSTLERRKHFCELELELNRRLAPSVYTGVVPIMRDASGRHRIEGPGEIVEYAVEMKRLDDRDSAEARLEAGKLTRADIGRIAQRLVEFHAAARCDEKTAKYGRREVIEHNVRENFEQTRDSAPQVLDRKELEAIERWQLGFIADREALFEQRIAKGRVRDGHGDLRLEHCYLHDEQVEIIDCIEFNERFRYGDVCADLAFLAMDLNRHERRDLSESLLANYAQACGDYDLYAVVDFYQSYRAYVRGKVSSILEREARTEDERLRAAATARQYYLLAEACMREPLDRPQLIAVGGMIASGKSTVARRIGELAHAPVIQSDRVRKSLAGVEPLTALRDEAFHGNYAPQRTEAVYAELLRCADVVLRSGRSVVLDASFRTREKRRAARELAAKHKLEFTFVETHAPEAVLLARLAEREKSPSVSDGRLEVFDAFRASFEPVEELAAFEHVRIDTTQPLRADHARLARLVREPLES
jgi:aminoglycoside phosphotransferase family enzyme/predicted kinase